MLMAITGCGQNENNPYKDLSYSNDVSFNPKFKNELINISKNHINQYSKLLHFSSIEELENEYPFYNKNFYWELILHFAIEGMDFSIQNWKAKPLEIGSINAEITLNNKNACKLKDFKPIYWKLNDGKISFDNSECIEIDQFLLFSTQLVTIY